MRAVVIDTPGAVRVDTIAEPSLPGPDGAIVQVRSAAICGSDLHFYDGDYPLVSPVSLGHEAVGDIVEIGSEVKNFTVGDTVLVSSVAGCGSCDGCATGAPATCVSGALVFGAGALGGAQAELLAVPAADFHLLRIPDGVDTEAALLLTDNLVTGWGGAQGADITPGDTVVVMGLGAVGLCAVRSAIALGAGVVCGIDPVQGRRDLAAASGATPLDPSEIATVQENTGDRGAASVIDAVASDTTLTAALTLVRAGGTVSVVGVHNLNPFPFPATMCLFRSVTLRSTTAPMQRAWPQLIPLIQAGRLETSGIFTHTMPLAEAPQAYDAVAARSADCVKVTLTM